jgi:hypothetical protein
MGSLLDLGGWDERLLNAMVLPLSGHEKPRQSRMTAGIKSVVPEKVTPTGYGSKPKFEVSVSYAPGSQKLNP